MYKYIIFDVDDTLIDFGCAFCAAQKNIAIKLGIELSKEYMELDEKTGWKAWKESGLDNTESEDVQRNYHTYYNQYLRNHYLYLTQELGVDACEDELVETYINSISESKALVEPSTMQVYENLAKHFKLALATNGMEKVQMERVSDFLPYTYKTYISETIGCIKPSKQFFEYVIKDLKCNPKECLMVGDSLTNDIIGAKTAGMDVCFYNRKKKDLPKDLLIDYEINSIQELVKILL